MNRIRKKGSAFDLFALGFGAIIGVGWSVTLNSLVLIGGGPLPTAIGFFASILLIVPIALCFAELTPAMPVAGGVMVYAHRAYNSRTAFVGGWFILMAYLSLLPWEAIAINDVMAFLLPAVKGGPILYTIAGHEVHLREVILGLALSAFIVLINWRGANATAKFQSSLIIVLIVCAILCIVFGFAKFRAENYLPAYASVPDKSHHSFFGGVLSLCAVSGFYFCGFDTIPQGVEDLGASIEPRKTGKVIVNAVVISGIFYILVVLAAGCAMPWQEMVGLARPTFPVLLRSVYGDALGGFLFWVCLIGTLAGLLSTWNGFFIAGSRLLLGMGRARFVPPFFAKQSRFGNPVGGNVACAVAMFAGPFLGSGIIDLLLQLGSTAFIIGWLLVCMSAVRLRKTEPDMPRPYKMPGGKLMGWLAILSSGFMLLNCLVPVLPGFMGVSGLYVLAAWIVLGILFYGVTKDLRCKITEEEILNAIYGKAAPISEKNEQHL